VNRPAVLADVAMLRDALVAKLLSGELRVRNI